MPHRNPEMPGAVEHLAAKLEVAVVDSLKASMTGTPTWYRLFCYCGDGMYRVSVRCNRFFLDVSIRSVTPEGEEDDGISIMFCASLGHRSRIQVEHSARELGSEVFSAVRFGTLIAETAAASWEQSRNKIATGMC